MEKDCQGKISWKMYDDHDNNLSKMRVQTGKKEECRKCGIVFNKFYQKKKISTDGFNKLVAAKHPPLNPFSFYPHSYTSGNTLFCQP
jgi:hypothetical protein